MKRDSNGDQHSGGDEAEESARDLQIDSAIEGSFPASDPPPWTLGPDRGGANSD